MASVFIGTKGIMATCSRGRRRVAASLRAVEGVRAASAAADPLARTHAGLDSRLQRRRSRLLGFQHHRALRRVAGPRRYRLARPGKLEWDSANLRFTNSAEANKFVKPVFRKGWEMKL